LNDPTYVEAARVFAQRIMTEGGEESDSRINLAFSYALSRAPRPEELALLRDLYHQHLVEYTNDPASAEALLKTGLAPLPEVQNPVDLAAWTSVARVILNLHETITRS
jgi:FMN phosphatase YigB (HAD superfamily)